MLRCRVRLEKEAEELSKAGDTESERLMDVYERLEELDASTAETKAARILHGLGQSVCLPTYMYTCTCECMFIALFITVSCDRCSLITGSSLKSCDQRHVFEPICMYMYMYM